MTTVPKILYVFGTRPEAIKLFPLIMKSKKDSRVQTLVCSTGQHREMLRSLFELFQVKPDYDFDLMTNGQSLTDVTIAVLTGLQNIFKAERPDVVVVQGDTTTCFAASVAAFQDKVKIVHVEAGLRSGDIDSPFPEEFNRKATGLIADFHFAPTEDAKQNLIHDGVSENRIQVTGNTGIDALFEIRDRIYASPALRKTLHADFEFLDKSKKLILVTMHRRESFGRPMEQAMRGLLQLAERSDIQILIPLHMNPNVRECAERVLKDNAQWADAKNESKSNHRIWLCEPQDYPSFVYLMDRAHLIITDSGGVQEEAPSLGKPVFVARDTTERPEAIAAGTSKLIPLVATKFTAMVNEILDDEKLYKRMAQAKNPFGDGKACEKILAAMIERYGDHSSPSENRGLPLKIPTQRFEQSTLTP